MRRTRLRSGGKTLARRKRLKAAGPKKASRKKRYTAFLHSAAWAVLRRAAIERAGGRCERMIFPTPLRGVRCPATTHLTVHHRTYARFGGKERPNDLQCLCKPCHDALHGRNGRSPW